MPRVDDKWVLSGITFKHSICLPWRDVPSPYGLHKKLYIRWKRWNETGIFARIIAGLATEHGEEKTVVIDATYLKAHCTVTSMVARKGGRSTCSCRRTGQRLHPRTGAAEQPAKR